MRAWSVAILGSAAAALFASCTFPEPDVVERPDGAAGADASAEDATRGSDADCSDPCDCDRDGVKSNAAGCGGPDCDDLDPSTKPGAAFTDRAPSPGRTGDWNCDAVAEPRWEGNVDCFALLGGACEREGFTGEAPACGAEGDFVVCADDVAGVSCKAAAPAQKKTQQCR